MKLVIFTDSDDRHTRADGAKKQLFVPSSVEEAMSGEPQPSTSTGASTRRAPLCFYDRREIQVAVVSGNKAEAQPKPPSGDSPLPPLPKPPRYRVRKPIWDIDLTYPSFRLKREARAREQRAKQQKLEEDNIAVPNDLTTWTSSDEERHQDRLFDIESELYSRRSSTDIDSTSEEEAAGKK